jgi:hypothetical protein
MMRISKIEHRPFKALFDYFERAVEELGLKAWATLLMPGNEQYFRDKIAPAVYRTLEEGSSEQEREEILSDPERHLRWESRENPEEEIHAYYRLQAAIVAAVMGDDKGLRTLAAQLIVEHMNRKLEVSHFLGNLTDGQVGVVYPELPTKTQVLQWVRDIEQVQLANRLGEIARFKYE